MTILSWTGVFRTPNNKEIDLFTPLYLIYKAAFLGFKKQFHALFSNYKIRKK